jgi:hypothetical protein
MSRNLSRLDSLLRRRIHSTIPGVTAPYLYMGMWKATFAWHVEDMDLYSINFLHYGAEKIWYSASAADGKRLERIASEIFPKSANHCGQFLRHKMHLINPSLITQRGLNLTRVVHRAGEYVISFPYAYHCGFNVALNCAESCNFASQNWVPYGLKVKACKCFEDSVKIKMSIFTSDKAMKKHRRAESNADSAVDDILCEICDKGHDDHAILLCDSCTGGYHMACLTPPLSKKPAVCVSVCLSVCLSDCLSVEVRCVRVASFSNHACTGACKICVCEHGNHSLRCFRGRRFFFVFVVDRGCGCARLARRRRRRRLAWRKRRRARAASVALAEAGAKKLQVRSSKA